MNSTILPVPHSTEIPVPIFVKFKDCDDLNSSFASDADDVTDPDRRKKEEIIVFCHNIEGRLQYLGAVSYDPHDWYLFLNSLEESLKCTLNQNGNEYASVPIGHSVHVNETYTSVKQLLSLIKYDDHKWVICVDLKMVIILLTLRGGYTT